MSTKRITAARLSLVFGGGIVAIAAAGFSAGLLGLPFPLAAEGIAAVAGMVLGANA